MQKPYSPHAQFFTSLKHLEKRLKLEYHESAGASTFPQPPPIERQEITQQTDSLGTPIYLYNQSTSTSNIQESEAPQEFLSPANHDQAQRADQPERLDLGALMQLLRLSDDVGCERDDDEFFERIVGVEGPKNAMELGRLEGWIQHFLKGRELFRLVHLLLAKAALIHSDDGLVFPSTISEFLQVDPPMD